MAERIADAPRLDWVDKARGLGIGLVVAGHALGGLIDSHRAPAGGAFQMALAVIYIFHMPLFFILSAYFISARLQRGVKSFVKGWWASLIWPVLLWSVIMILVLSLAPAAALNHAKPHVLASILQLPYAPVGPFWFIYALLLFQAVAALFEALGWRQATPVVLVILGALHNVEALGVVARVIFGYAPWYAAGLVLGRTGQGAQSLSGLGRPVRAGMLAAIAALFAVAGPMAQSQWPARMAGGADTIASFAWSAMFWPLAFGGVCAVLMLAQMVGGAIGRGAAYVGKRSMVIYVQHVIVIAALRTLLVRLQVSDGLVLLLAETVLGVAIPLAIFEVACRLRLEGWLGLGRAVGGPARKPSGRARFRWAAAR